MGESQPEGRVNTGFDRSLDKVSRACEDDEELSVAIAHGGIQRDTAIGPKGSINVGIAIDRDRRHDDRQGRGGTNTATDFFDRSHILLGEPDFFTSGRIESSDANLCWVCKESIEVQRRIAIGLSNLVVQIVDIEHPATVHPVLETSEFGAIGHCRESVVSALSISRHVVNGVR